MMSEMNEKAEEPQEQAADRPPIPPEQLKEILEAHRKWVESEGKEGERAILRGANLSGADLFVANLSGAILSGAMLSEAMLSGANLSGAFLYKIDLSEAILFEAILSEAILSGANLSGALLLETDLSWADLRGARNLIASQVKIAMNWQLAFYSEKFLEKLGLPPDHNETVKEELAELEKEEKATGAK